MLYTITTHAPVIYFAGTITILCVLKTLPAAARDSCTELSQTILLPMFEDKQFSLNVTYTVNEDLTLDAIVTWGPPPTNRFSQNLHGYALKITLDLQETACLEQYITTTNLSHTFKHVSYGEDYGIEIRAVNSEKKFASYTKKFETGSPDCYEETGNREFCRHQSITTLSKVTDIRLECIVRNPMNSQQLEAYISWGLPLQINDTLNLTDVEIRYNELNNSDNYGKDTVITQDLYKKIFLPDERYVSHVTGILEEKNYTLSVKIYAGETVWNKNSLFLFDTLNLSTSYVAQRWSLTSVNACFAVQSTAVTPNTTLSRRRSVAEQRLLSNEATLVVLIIMSILVILTLVALIFCYVRRRSITHLSKQGVFGMYPDETGEPHKNPETEALRQKGSPFMEGDRGLDANARRSGGNRGEVWQTVQSSLGVNIFYEPHSHSTPALLENDPIFQSKEFNRSFLKIEDKLGSGQFGVVYKGFACGIDGVDKYVPVAVKSLKMDATDAMRIDFLDEIKLIIEIGNHPNVLPILGCCTSEEPYYLITEFMKYGDLLRFLLRCREEVYQEQDGIYRITKRGQLQISRQIARGMEYLSSTRYYHGDLAARNVLVGDGLVVKISDFGLADDIYQQGYKRLAPERKRPVKWVSLETNTRGQCTIQSDVWSFGIVLYEIYTFGDVPYPGLDGRDVVTTLMEGFRMDQPDNCPNEIYEIMLQCWHESPYDRPSFTELYTRLDDMLSQSSDYICDFESNVRYHPDTLRTVRISSSPIPIPIFDEDAIPQPPDPFHVLMKGVPPSPSKNDNIVQDRFREFEIDECTC